MAPGSADCLKCTDAATDWLTVDLDPTQGFEQVENMDFKQLRHSLAQLESSMRLLGRTKGCDDPHAKLKPSARDCLTRTGPDTERRVEKLWHALNKPCVHEPAMIQIQVKHETDNRMIELCLPGPATLLQVKEAMLVQLGYGLTSEIQFVVQGGSMSAVRHDSEIILSGRRRRPVVLTVRGIELPNPRAERERYERTVPMGSQAEDDMSSVSSCKSWRRVELSDAVFTQRNSITQYGDDTDWSML